MVLLIWTFSIKINGVNLAGDSPAAVEKRIEILFRNSLSYGPCIVFIKSVRFDFILRKIKRVLAKFFLFKFHFLFKFRDLNQCNKRISSTFFKIISQLKTNYLKLNLAERLENWFYVVCTCETKDELDANILSHFNSELEIKVKL